MTIPSKLHFCWLGNDLPWAYAFSVLSAAEQSGIDEIILHHGDPLEAGSRVTAISRCPRVRFSRIDPVGCLRICGRMVGVGERLNDLYRGLRSPAVQADVLRAALLYLEGGLYLDMDTVTLAPLEQLLGLGQFVGSERIVWPGFVRHARSPHLWARSITLDVMRKALRCVPGGWRYFRRLERFYYRAATNSVMGAEAGAPFFRDYLRAMLSARPRRGQTPYTLGPDLLQELLRKSHDDRVASLDPRISSPLPPEISEHWFRFTTKPPLAAVLFPETRIVHWYASIHTKPKVARIDPRYIREHREHQLYSALVWSRVAALRTLR